ncbi:MAG TPA: P-II family nitrogen regulator [Gammaproteobacteria bacterium]|nr:P-II family nitrogen regulator [Gammaproteobacteria bacterium]
MSFKKITAIIRPDLLNKAEKVLKELGVPGVSVSQVKGYGEYADFYAKDWMVTHARIEVIIDTARAEEIAQAIMDAAHTGLEGDGIVSIVPVEKLYHIRTKAVCDEKPG